MEIDQPFSQFVASKDDVKRTLRILADIFDLPDYGNLSNQISFTDNSDSGVEEEIYDTYRYLIIKSELSHFPSNLDQEICSKLDHLYRLGENLGDMDQGKLIKLLHLRIAWDEQSPHAWYELGKMYYERFISRTTNNQEEIIAIFRHVIKLVESHNAFHDMGFWAYSYMANLYLYRILSGEEALVQAMKNYNQAYRFSQMYGLQTREDFIFDDLEILQNILMNKYPLLVLIYNHSGISLFEYLFQFVEVITQEQRFIPNFTALLSVVDERMHELFNSPISNAYLVIENRLMVMTKLYDEDKKNWVKIAFIFSYLQQDEEDVEIDPEILRKVRHFKHALLGDDLVSKHLIDFDGKHNEKVNIRIEELLHHTFSEDT